MGIKSYDAEAFSARCSDIAVFETDSLEEYAFLMDNIKNSKTFTVPYFGVAELPGQSGGLRLGTVLLPLCWVTGGL